MSDGKVEHLVQLRMQRVLRESHGDTPTNRASNRGLPSVVLEAIGVVVRREVAGLVDLNDTVLTRDEVGALLKVCSKTVTNLVRKGRLPATRMSGGAYRFRKSDVLRWMSAHAQRREG